MSGFGDYLSWGYVIPAFGVALAYGWFIYRSVQVKRAGGLAAHSRAHLDRLFQMPPDTRVTAAWEAVTIPKKRTGQKTMEAAGAAFAAVGGVGIEFVGRNQFQSASASVKAGCSRPAAVSHSSRVN